LVDRKEYNLCMCMHQEWIHLLISDIIDNIPLLFVAIYFLSAIFTCKSLQDVHNKFPHFSTSSCCFILLGLQE
jgi:hypothetical protein